MDLMRRIFKFALLILAGILFLKLSSNIWADINSDCQNEAPSQIVAEGKTDECTQILGNIAAAIGAANATNQKNLSQLQSQLNSLNAKLNALSDELTKTAADISSREENMGFTQEVLNQKTRDYYTFLRLYDPITPFLFADSASNAFQELSLRQKAQTADVSAIEQYVNEINDLKNSQAALQKSQASVSAVQKQIAQQTNFLAGEVAKANNYLATLSARQEAFIEAKLESLGISRSAYNLNGGCSSDINPYKAPNFGGTEFAFFTFGVPNRVGMDQYGAYGRANAGQGSDQILHAYYNFDGYQNFSNSIKINVQGYGSYNLEDYVKRIYEVPDNWPMEALKAQAIAARSYVLAYTNGGAGSICTTQQCQVFQPNPKGGNWEQAVDATAGQVMVQGGQPIKAWFSATHGGYEYTSADIGWSATPWTKRLVDTTTGNAGSFADLMNNAYDKSSPVFYCDWGGRSDQNKTAWLSSTDLADIVNAVLLAEKDGSTKSHLYQTDKPNPEGTDTWSADQVKSNLGSSAFNTITDVSVGVDFGTGRTTTVTISGDAPSQTINGDDFKNYFNLRAPANIQIVGPLYNIEKH